MFKPLRSATLVINFGHCEVREQAIRGGAVPMTRIRGNDAGISRAQLLDLLAFELKSSATLHDV